MAILKSMISSMRRRKYLWLLVWFLILFAGVDLLWNPPKGAHAEYLLLGLVLFVLGLLFLLFLLLPKEKMRIEAKEGSLSTILLHFLTAKGRLRSFFPLIGASLVVLDIMYNIFLSATPELLTHDTIVIIFGVVMILYNFIPERFERERDFIFLFFAGLIVILVIPLMLARIVIGDIDKSVGIYSAYLLVPEVAGLLNLIGVPAIPNGLEISFTPPEAIESVRVYISTACSGIYSFSIFSSAFLAFVFTEYNKLDKKVGLLMILGVLTAYVANILRMVIIILVGYYTYTPEEGLQAMLIAHSNAGWIIFLIWIGLFWFLMYRFLIRPEESAGFQATKQITRCGVCGEMMKVDIPGTRCECGSFLHMECLSNIDECPKCGIRFQPSGEKPSEAVES